MCVIMATHNASKTPISKEWMEGGAKANSDGAGMAWIENGKVQYFKSMDSDKVISRALKIKGALMVHFRIGTIGSKNAQLCHPFPISEGVSLAPQGTAGAVLAHNGHWGGWKDVAKLPVLYFRAQWPKGEWSDSRGMAFLAWFYGVNSLDVVLPESGQKVCVMTTKGLEFYGGPWEIEKGVHLSNTAFKFRCAGYQEGSGYYGNAGGHYRGLPGTNSSDEVWDFDKQKWVHKSQHPDWQMEKGVWVYRRQLTEEDTVRNFENSLDESLCESCQGTGELYHGTPCYFCGGSGLQKDANAIAEAGAAETGEPSKG